MASQSNSNDLTTFRFSKKGSWEALPMWYEVFHRAISRRMCSPLSDDPFYATVTVRRLSGTSIASGTNTGVCVQRMTFTAGLRSQRTPELLTDGNDDVALLIPKTGRIVLSQLGREAAAEPGGGLLSSIANVSTMIFPGPCRFVCIGVPRKLMLAMVPGVEDALARPLPPNAGVVSLLMSYLDILEDERSLETPELQRAATTHIHDLCALAVGATRDATEIANGRGVRAARLRAIKADIVQNLRDADVSAAAVARRHGVTARYIHKLFESDGTTLSKFVLGQRLAHVHRMLRDPRQDHRLIATLAYEAGFGDISTFNREFRRHFGATPSDVRAAPAQ
jgi:AraC-like DNA-binding protein